MNDTTRNAIEALKRHEIVDLAINYLGFEVVKEKDSKNWRTLVSPNGVKIYTKNKPNEEGIYFFARHDGGKGGTAIELMKLAGMKW